MSIHQKMLAKHQQNNQNQQYDQAAQNQDNQAPQLNQGQQNYQSNTTTTGNTGPFVQQNNYVQQGQYQNNAQYQNQYQQGMQYNNNLGGYVQNINEKNQIEEIQQWAENFNAPKLYVRSTTDCYPKSKKLYQDSNYKFALIIQPFGSQDVDFPVASTKCKNIIRCDNCRAYLNPFCRFMNDGYKYKCNICDRFESVPNFYYSPLDENGYRKDMYEKPELCYGSFDIIAGQDYVARPPMPPTFFFLIDVSKASVESGMLSVVANQIKATITDELLAGKERTQVGFVTYDSKIHIYNLKSSLKQPQMFVLSDLTDIEIPIPDDLIVTLSDSKDLVLNLLDSLPKMFENTQINDSCLTFALNTVNKIIQTVGGRLFIFQNSASIINEPVFQSKQDPNKKPQPGETLQFQYQLPASSHFRNICSEMHINFINPSIFIFSDTFKNAITIGELARFLNGDIYYYYDKLTRQQQLEQDLKYSLEKSMSWESVFRIRITQGFRVSNVIGNFSVKSTDLLSYPCDENKSLIYEIEMDDTIARGTNLSIQTALLYTTSDGERRIRSHNYIIPLTSDPYDIYKQADCSALTAYLARNAISKIYLQPISNLKAELIGITKRICSSAISVNQNQLPDTLAQLPLNVLGIMKHAIFTSNYQNTPLTDFINIQRLQFNSMPVDEMLVHFVPYLFCIDDMKDENVSYIDDQGLFVYPQSSLTAFSSLGKTIYLMDLGQQLILYINTNGTDWNYISDVIGSTDFSQVFTEENLYANTHNRINEQLSNLVQELRKRKSTKYCPLNIVIAGTGSPLENLFYYKLIEDKYVNYSNGYNASYEEFIKFLM
ncbi:hypothetical protein ABPG74_014726 [Tetrahymena malaccensis]